MNSSIVDQCKQIASANGEINVSPKYLHFDWFCLLCNVTATHTIAIVVIQLELFILCLPRIRSAFTWICLFVVCDACWADYSFLFGESQSMCLLGSTVLTCEFDTWYIVWRRFRRNHKIFGFTFIAFFLCRRLRQWRQKCVFFFFSKMRSRLLVVHVWNHHRCHFLYISFADVSSSIGPYNLPRVCSILQ